MEDQARRFLGDDSRNRVTDDGVAVSPLFKWYREDFTGGWRRADSLGAFLALYADALGPRRVDPAALKAGDLPVKFLDYDWGLNSASPPRER